MLASLLGQIGHPFYLAFAWILAGCFALIPNFAIAIALLTILVMIAVFPITISGARSAVKMQLVGPQIQKIRAKSKIRSGATTTERREVQQRERAELMALYKENKVSPMGGCLPVILQVPVFIVLYGTIRGLIHQTGRGVLRPDPLYVGHATRIFKAIGTAHGQLRALGMNLADSVRTAGLGWHSKVPLMVVVLVAIALQYFQMKQVSDRSPAGTGAIPGVRLVQRILPLVSVVLYISMPAGVMVYFIVASLLRIVQQFLLYRHDPYIRTSVELLGANPSRISIV
jgi:YidC/Oxa1 family membrane protein insertase